MTTLTVSREVRIPRRRGLMARALEQPPTDIRQETTNGESFASAISLPKPAQVSSGLKTSVQNTRDPNSSTPDNSVLSQNTIESKLSLAISNEYSDPFSPNVINPEARSPTGSSDVLRKRRISKQASSEVLLNPIQEHENVSEEQLLSTQHLRSGFFRTIKKQYPTAAFDNLGLSDYTADSGRGSSIESPKSPSYEQDSTSSVYSDRSEEEVPFMSSMARRRLRELRKADPTKVDVGTGLQWIRLELHEMREQDKALFLQLIKLHGTIKEIRSHMKFMEESCDCSLDSMDEVASYWWPRCNGSSVLPDFSSSDGAHLLTRRQSRPMVRRGFSFNQPRRTLFSSNLSAMSSGSAQSFSSSMSSSQSGTAL